MNHFYLVGSSLLLLFPIILFIRNPNKNAYETGLAILLSCNIILSFLFWMQPIRHNQIHFYDGIFAKISVVLFTIYILFVKKMENIYTLLFFFFLFIALYMFYCSSIHSCQEWCSDTHIIYHLIFHIFISLGCMVVFIPFIEPVESKIPTSVESLILTSVESKILTPKSVESKILI